MTGEISFEYHNKFMDEALVEAKIALKKNEVPVGSVIVWKDKIIGRGHNLRESSGDPTAHAEMIAIEEAAKFLGGWRLSGAALYVTLEPCIMCMGAIVQARISQLVFGPFDEKGGACGSLYDIANDKRLNHIVKVVSGVKSEEASSLLKTFFKERRKDNKVKADTFMAQEEIPILTANGSKLLQ